MRILSLGWGVQSFTIAAMAALGEIPPIDIAIHADTYHESSLTYAFRERWTKWLEEHMQIVVVTSHKKENIINKHGGVQIPAFTNGQNRRGQIHRQCTREWKIRPIHRCMSAELERRRLKKTPNIIHQLIGISLDEFQRMRMSDVKFITNIYPLVEKSMTRMDCIKWLNIKGLELPPRSACTFCPFKTTEEWQNTKKTQQDWKEAIAIDELIREARPPELLYIHPSRKPLINIDFRTIKEKGQLSLWDAECSGICGV